MPSLEESYQYCRRVARARARNFYYSFVLLTREQRAAMCAVYAFMRYCDDLSDEPGASREKIESWRAALEQALAGRFDSHPCWPAFHDTVARYGIPHRYFFEMIEGVASDLEPHRFATFQDLYGYCYRVASVVGLTTVHIFGFRSPEALPLAEKCGIAFQSCAMCPRTMRQAASTCPRMNWLRSGSAMRTSPQAGTTIAGGDSCSSRLRATASSMPRRCRASRSSRLRAAMPWRRRSCTGRCWTISSSTITMCSGTAPTSARSASCAGCLRPGYAPTAASMLICRSSHSVGWAVRYRAN